MNSPQALSSKYRMQFLEKVGIFNPSTNDIKQNVHGYLEYYTKMKEYICQKSTIQASKVSASFIINDKLDNSIGETNIDEYENNYSKKANDLRIALINKLSLQGQLFSEKEKKYQTITIFDWDDTLFPTSVFSHRMNTQGKEIIDIDKPLEKDLNEIDLTVTSLFQKALLHGHVFIVSNATDYWLEFSRTNYLPEFDKLLLTNKENVTVISARNKFEKMYPDKYDIWKENTFVDIGNKMPKDIITNILVIGDSCNEIEAARSMGKIFNTQNPPLIKTIKFKEGPLSNELSKELKLLTTSFDKIANEVKSITIKLEKKSSNI